MYRPKTTSYRRSAFPRLAKALDFSSQLQPSEGRNAREPWDASLVIGPMAPWALRG